MLDMKDVGTVWLVVAWRSGLSDVRSLRGRVGGLPSQAILDTLDAGA